MTRQQRRLELADVTIVGVPGSLELTVPVGEISAVIVPPARARAVADVIVGLEPPRSGSVKVDGEPITGDHHRVRRDGVRLVPSDGGLLPHLTVLRNILYAECVVERRPSELLEKIVRKNTAIEYGLRDVLDRYPYEITIGRRRKAGLARALRANPSVVVLEDDPEALTWTALLGDSPPDLEGVAAVLVTSDRQRARGFPIAFHCGDGQALDRGGEGDARDHGNDGQGPDG